MGAPTITGTAQVGQTLTAVTTGITDADGLTSPTYTYQWIRVDGTDEEDISGENSSTYTLVDADLGKTIKVKVSFDDDASNAETLTSAATVTVTAAGTTNTAPTVANPIQDQTATVGTVLTYAFPANTFNDTDPGGTLAYTATKSDDSALPSWLSFAAATRTFSGTPTATDVGTVSVKVTASDGCDSVSDTFDIVVSTAADTTPPEVESVTVDIGGSDVYLVFDQDPGRDRR